MYQALEERDRSAEPIRVALVGAGSMGVGIAWQIGHTPGMRLVAVTDIDLPAARRAADAHGGASAVVGPGDRLPPPGTVLVSRAPFYLDAPRPELGIDVVVESTNTIGFAARVCRSAIDAGMHVVLMNAEVDLALGPLLHHEARGRGVVVTSDAGDQHGVLMRMIDEIRLWAFRVVMAGNIKGFLDRHATAASLAHEARIRNLNPVQCCAYTDGTKLGVEMALVSNATGLVPWVPGMEGPPARDVHEVFTRFDFDRYGEEGVVDYILGAEPGGGVFVVGRCDDPLQREYLRYYKMGSGPYYLFYRPYHLCHLETTRAIALAALRREAVLEPSFGRVSDVYATARRDLASGEVFEHAIGGDLCYGVIERCTDADRLGKVPIALLEGEAGAQARVRRPVRADAPLDYDDVVLPDTELVVLFRRQAELLAAAR
jgi:predicted homoserine dehydrogenase-like protein